MNNLVSNLEKKCRHFRAAASEKCLKSRQNFHLYVFNVYVDVDD